jgi:hypothetical protein
MSPLSTETRSVWHRKLAPECHVYVWHTTSPEGVAHTVSIEGDDLERLEPEHATMLAGIVLLAAKFAKREQDLAGAGRRRRPA